MTREQLNQQVYLGYFATLMLALLMSASAASSLAPWLIMRFAEFDHPRIEGQLTSGLFFAICFANPVGVWIKNSSAKRMVARAIVGMVFGGALHCLVLEPMVGDALLRFSLLLVGALGVPVLMGFDKWCQYRYGCGTTSAGEKAARFAVRLFRWPERALFVVLMLATFLVFLSLTDTPAQSLVGLVVLLLLMTGLVAYRSSLESSERRANTSDFQAWLDLLPEEAAQETEIAQELRRRANRFAFTIFPGAAFIGGVMGAAVSLVPVVHPEIEGQLAARTEALEATYVIAATGFGLIVLGMVFSVLLSMLILRVIGHYARWQNDQVRSAMYRLMRTVSLRPVNRT